MDWIAQNDHDTKLLPLVDLSPLEIEPGGMDEAMLQQVASHNTSLADLKQRFDQLATDRRVMSDPRPRKWYEQDSGVVVTECRRLIAESWDVLATLRKLLTERESLLRRCEGFLANQSAELEAQQDATFDAARQVLVRRHRTWLKTDTRAAESHIEQSAWNDPTVIELGERIKSIHVLYDNLYATRQKIYGCQSFLAARQRELFIYLAA